MEPALPQKDVDVDEIPTTALIEAWFSGSRRRSVLRHNEVVLKDARRARHVRRVQHLMRRICGR